MSKIGVLVIATGKYDMFIPPLFKSIKKHFMTNHEVTVFIFYFQGSIKARKNLAPGEVVNSDSVNTNQLHDLKNKGIIQITSSAGHIVGGGNRVITHNAIYPTKKCQTRNFKRCKI